MLCIICGKTLRDGLSNYAICDKTGMEKIEEFMRQQRLHKVWVGGKDR